MLSDNNTIPERRARSHKEIDDLVECRTGALALYSELAARQPGYLGVESVRGADGFGITVSYWESQEAIRAWRDEAEHRIAQDRGRREWYEAYELRVCRVERAQRSADPAK